jgi:hypothetical protein
MTGSIEEGGRRWGIRDAGGCEAGWQSFIVPDPFIIDLQRLQISSVRIPSSVRTFCSTDTVYGLDLVCGILSKSPKPVCLPFPTPEGLLLFVSRDASAVVLTQDHQPIAVYDAEKTDASIYTMEWSDILS